VYWYFQAGSFPAKLRHNTSFVRTGCAGRKTLRYPNWHFDFQRTPLFWGMLFAARLTMNDQYTAVITHEGDWWIGWIEEIPGVNCQENSRDELLDTLEATLREAIEFNSQDARQAAGGNFQEEKIAV
jgi:predicted RNase H-like HicB family nuclease